MTDHETELLKDLATRMHELEPRVPIYYAKESEAYEAGYAMAVADCRVVVATRELRRGHG